MSRLVWVGIGAAGGIYAYRKSQRAWGRTKERGVAGTATLAAHTAARWYGQVRDATLEAQQNDRTTPGEVIDLTDSALTQRRFQRQPQGPAPAVTMAQWTPLRSDPGS